MNALELRQYCNFGRRLPSSHQTHNNKPTTQTAISSPPYKLDSIPTLSTQFHNPREYCQSIFKIRVNAGNLYHLSHPPNLVMLLVVYVAGEMGWTGIFE